MADFSKIKEAGQNETMVIQRGMVLLAGMAGGAGLVYGLLQWLSNAEPSTLAGIAGPFSLGLKNAAEQLLALGMVVGGLVGAILGQLGWIFLGQIQKMISPLDSQTVLKRAAAPFIVFFPQITFLCQGKAALINPIISFLGLVFGLLLLALLEKKDKRKIYFAHPTENEYTPLGFFAHGCMILLGAGAGWFWQSLPLAGTAARGGLWFALNVGIVFWIVSLLLAALMNLFFSKQTFDQNYIALCLAMMPLALLPLQAAGWIDFIKDGQVVAHHGVQWLPVVLPALSGVGIAVILAFSILKLRRQPVETGPA